MEDFFTPSAVATVGFPIIMCIWLIRNGQQTISENTKANAELTKAISSLTEAIGSQSTRLEHIDTKLSHLTELFVEHKTKTERTDRHEGH
ncbi:MAG: hypothetical protein IJ668_00060 [Selenomonadaceae bacterium]|nr:hypothetical protein [Selenomonadaceae bacterium]